MAGDELVVRGCVAKDLRAIPRADLQRILKSIQALTDDPGPPGCEKLAGGDHDRIRQGCYRILYQVHDRQLLVTVVKVGHRSEVYRHP